MFTTFDSNIPGSSANLVKIPPFPGKSKIGPRKQNYFYSCWFLLNGKLTTFQNQISMGAWHKKGIKLEKNAPRRNLAINFLCVKDDW